MSAATSVGRLLSGRRDVPAGARALGYGSGERTMFLVLLPLSLLETVGLHLVLRHQSWVWGLTAASLLTVVFLLVKLAELIVYPHVLTADALRVRNGAALDLTVPFSAIDSVRWVSKADHTIRRPTASGCTLALPSGGITNVELALNAPVVVAGFDAPVELIQLSVDARSDFQSLLDAVAAAGHPQPDAVV